jgi:hypothetical protein
MHKFMSLGTGEAASRRTWLLLGGGILTGLVAWALATAALGTAATRGAPARASAAAPIKFSHAVIVDEQRPGFEPDVKVDSKDVTYSSVPNGFSTTISYVWFSHDHGNSYLPISGSLGAGIAKPLTCIGGGDSDLYLDPHNALYFSDLQGLTNISNSVSTNGGKSWSTNCAGAPNSPDDRMWFAGMGSLATKNLVLYQDFDVVAGAPVTGDNALVETESTNGTVFEPVDNSAPSSDCAGAAPDCVTGNEGISGNQVVDPKTGNVYIAHTTTEGSSGEVGVRVAEGKITPGTPPSAVWSESPNLDGPLCPGSKKAADGSNSCVDKNGNAQELAGENFATVARDSAGYLYVTFTAGPLDHASSSDPNFGALTAPEQIYVVHSLAPAGKDPSKVKWSKPERITGTGLSTGTNTFPWITAGSGGRVAVAWYHANEKHQKGTCASGSGTCTLYGASSLTKAEWTVQMGQSLNAHGSSPKYTAAKVSEGPVKSGQICTNGIGCTTGGDRSLGDYLQISTDKKGAAVVSFVFDTSRDSSDGEEVGPDAISRQISGPSLFASRRNVTQGSGPGLAMGSVKDPTGDDFYSANGSLTPAGSNLDLTGASLANGKNKTLVAKIHVKSLSSLSVSPSVGGPDGSWILRWTVVHPGKNSGGYPINGHIYYVGMDNNAGAGGSGTPSFFVGDTGAVPPPGNPADHTKYITFPQSKTLSSKQASYDHKTGVITLKIPLSDVGKPAKGTRLYSVTAFTATSLTPQSGNTLFNQVDATPPFELVIGAPGTTGGKTSSGHGGTHKKKKKKASKKPKRSRGFTG